ncbi:nitroreductase family protein [Acetobacter garciniae]|nr:nitroreductase [Acetobacter garciniae]
MTAATPMDVLLSRASTDRLADPAPSAAQLEQILAAALRAPDHGRLRPWRYIVIEGEARPLFAQKVVDSMLRLDPQTPEFNLTKRRTRFATMPMTIALGMHLRVGHKIPLWEQEMAVAAGAMNILNALHALGFGGIWVSGPVTQDPVLATELGLAAPHRLAGFIFVGTPDNPHPAPARPDPAAFSARWQGAPVTFSADKD